MEGTQHPVSQALPLSNDQALHEHVQCFLIQPFSQQTHPLQALQYMQLEALYRTLQATQLSRKRIKMTEQQNTFQLENKELEGRQGLGTFRYDARVEGTDLDKYSCSTAGDSMLQSQRNSHLCGGKFHKPESAKSYLNPNTSLMAYSHSTVPTIALSQRFLHCFDTVNLRCNKY